jgi:putative peptide maturation system protein
MSTVVEDVDTAGPDRTAGYRDLASVAREATEFLQQALERRQPAPVMRAELAAIESRLQADMPGMRLHLVPHVEPFDGSTVHDVVVRVGRAVLVVGLSTDTDVPWPLRGVARAGEQRVLRVNAQKLDVADALACLDFVFDERDTMGTLIRSCLVAEALEEHDVDLSEEQVQRAADAFRRGKGLLTREQTRSWREQRAMSESEFVALVRRTAHVAELRRRIAGPEKVSQHFAEHRDRYGTVLVACVEGDPVNLSGDPLAAVASARRAGRSAGVSEWQVGDLPEGMAGLVEAPVGEPVSVDLDGVPGAAVVVDRRDAVLDAVTATRIEREIFAAWLDARRSHADVEWYWGDALRTSLAS